MMLRKLPKLRINRAKNHLTELTPVEDSYFAKDICGVIVLVEVYFLVLASSTCITTDRFFLRLRRGQGMM